MSKLRKILAAIQRTEEGDFNTELYKDGALENYTYLMKDDVVERVLEELDYEVDYENTPDEGYGFQFSVNGNGTLASVKSQYGELTEDDLHYLQEELNDSTIVDAYLKDLVNDVDSELGHFTIRSKFTVSGDTVKFTVELD